MSLLNEAAGERAVAQVKKEAVREAILAAALTSFRRHGYLGTSLKDIAAAAETSRANIYVYFRSKFELFYAVFHPWLVAQLEALESELAAIADPRQRLRRILTAIWREIPREANGFANNLIQALSTASADEAYSPALLRTVERRVADMIQGCLAAANRPSADGRAVAHVLFMAFDGFCMHAHLRTGEACSPAVIESMCALLFGSEAAAPAKRRRRA
ncbi:MAG: TetR/AcrR family transcriptional regulator [Rhodospirillaceae bacterium]|nr:TetR/AcrR family transcriptional regulator [Rhodospirillaceae bacterium]